MSCSRLQSWKIPQPPFQVPYRISMKLGGGKLTETYHLGCAKTCPIRQVFLQGPSRSLSSSGILFFSPPEPLPAQSHHIDQAHSSAGLITVGGLMGLSHNQWPHKPGPVPSNRHSFSHHNNSLHCFQCKLERKDHWGMGRRTKEHGCLSSSLGGAIALTWSYSLTMG